MARNFYLDSDGNVSRDIYYELPVQEFDPEVIRFIYGDHERVAQVITLKRGAATRPLLLALELWNSRDGLLPDGVTKTYHCDQIFNLENV